MRHATDVVTVFSPDGRILFQSPSVKKALARAPEEMVGRSIFDLVHPEDAEKLREILAEPGGGPVEMRLRYADGSWRRFESVVSNLSGDPDFGTVVACSRDVTERRRTEERLKETEARYRALVERVPGITYIQDLETRDTLYDSPQIEEMLGYPRDICEQDPGYWWKIVHPEDQERILTEERRSVESGKFSMEYRCFARDGRVVWVKDEAAIVHDDEGRPRFWLGVILDITEQKRVQEELRQSAELFRSVVQNSSEIVQIVGTDGMLRYASPAFGKVLGYDPEEAVGMNVLDHVHPEDLPRVVEETEKALQQPGVVTNKTEYRFRRADGSWCWIEAVGTYLLDDPSVRGVLVNARDVTDRKRTEEALRESEERFRGAFENASWGMAILGLDIRYQRVNRALCEMLGYTEEELVGMRSFDLTHPDDQEKSRSRARRMLEEGGPDRMSLEKRYVRKDGGVVWAISDVSLVRDERGRPKYFVTQFQDITRRRQAEEALRESEKRLRETEHRYRTLIEQIPLVTYIDRDQPVRSSPNIAEYTSPQIEKLMGYTREEWLSPERDLWRERLHPEDRDRVLAADDYSKASGEPFCEEYRLIARDGSVVWVRDEAVLLEDDGRGGRLWQGFLLDITERKALEERLLHQAFHDPLTGLANRALFTDRLQHALSRASRSDGRVAVLFMDLDNFKVINDSLGHDWGDRALELVADRLRSRLRPEDTVARLGGDEFAVLLEDADAGEAAAVAGRIAEGFRSPITLGGRRWAVTVSLGIAVGGSGQDAMELLRRADVAMYRVKARGRAGYEIFEAGLNEGTMRRLEVERDLRRALERWEFEVCYRPVVSLETGSVSGMHAALFWRHPERGLLQPREFASLAEETGMMAEVGRRMLLDTCCKVEGWNGARSGDSLALYITFDARYLRYPDLIRAAADVLRESGLGASSLVLEVSGSAAVQEQPESLSALQMLKDDLGVRVSIDGISFGGSSDIPSSRLPADQVKLGEARIRGLEASSADAEIVSATIRVAHALDLQILAEGVENVRQLKRLREIGCDLARGGYFSELLSADEAERLLREALRW